MEFGMVSEGIGANQALRILGHVSENLQILSLPLYFALSSFSPAAQLWFTECLDCFPGSQLIWGSHIPS